MERLYSILTIVLFFTSCKHAQLVHPQRKDLVETVYASGKITASDEHYLFALGNGTIIKKLVREGDTIKKGDVLFVINYEVPAAKLNAAKSNYKNIENNMSSNSAVLNDLRHNMENAKVKCTNDSLQYIRL